MKLENIKIILVEPQHAGNIGACARAMKNMGLSHLALVNPVEFMVEEGLKMAVDAKGILRNAELFTSLEKALRETSLSIGTTRRQGKMRKPVYSISTIARKISSFSEKNKVAFVFGREDKGLLTKELQLCTFVTTIPSSEKLPSLNLAHAVMITCYELFLTSSLPTIEEPPLLAKFEDVESFYRHLEGILVKIGFLNEAYPTTIMVALRRLFGKADLEPREVKILRGILRQIQWYVSRPSA
ncbi:MAG: RNA methyltransferase [Acidobacteriota bacterium]